jgi:metal-responsive CopG/Arc/MetJ family transcriptional regulator
MYIYIRRYKMKRTQIYIDEKIYSHLEKESKTKGVSISEIIRESIQEKLTKKIQKILRATDEVCGIWKDRKFDINSYIRDTRRERKVW